MAGLVVPNIESIECVDNFGKFVAEPLEKGFGVTLGNAMRRALLGYLPGAAVTKVRIDGVPHEYTVIPDAKEDVTDFLLNVKEIRVKPLSDRDGTLTLDIQGEGRICAADIKPSADFEIANPELYLITLNAAEARLYVELDVELGTGFKTAGSIDNMPVGTIPMDAIYTPIRKVNFTVEPTHIGRETSYERLYLEVWTDGTTSPVDAVSRAAGIIIEQLTPFFQYVKISQMEAEERLIRLSIPDEKYNMPVEQLDLSVRTMNCLRRSSITTVGELIGKGSKELLKLRNFGQKSFLEIEERLESIGLSLNPKVEQDTEETEDAEDAEAVATSVAAEEEPGESDETNVSDEDESQTGEASGETGESDENDETNVSDEDEPQTGEAPA